MHLRHFLVLLVGVLTAGLIVSGCTSTEQQSASPDTTYAAIIDVRTPGEYSESHVETAVNIDVQDPAFDAEIADLADEGTYLVYCRSGNRSAAAAERMKAAGLDVVDGGGVDTMEDAGFQFVRG